MSESDVAPKKKAAKKAVKKAPAKKAAKKAPAKKAPAKKAAVPALKTQSFENEFVKAEVKTSKACHVTIDVEVSKKVLQEAEEKALKEVSKNISVPGFRKGKVPREMVKKNYAAHIEDQADNLFLQKALEHALLLSELRPLNYRNVKPKIESKTKDSAKVTFEFETYPVVPEINLDKIKLKKVEIEDIDQERIDEVIDVMRTYRAKWNPVEERGVEKDDFVELDIENVEEKDKIVSQKRVQVAKGDIRF